MTQHKLLGNFCALLAIDKNFPLLKFCLSFITTTFKFAATHIKFRGCDNQHGDAKNESED